MKSIELIKQVTIIRKTRQDSLELYSGLLAPEFNIFNYINTDENKLSEILALILNPSGVHGQGAIFLKMFLEKTGLNFELAGEVKVTTEAPTNRISNANRRIDILLDSPNSDFALAIENKPWASDQELQCSDYLMHLEKMGRRKYCLFYLTPEGTEPDKKSLSEVKVKEYKQVEQFKLLSYKEIIEWLEDCRDKCQADRFRFFINDFIKYLNNTFLGIRDMGTIETIVETVRNDREKITSVFEIVKAKDLLIKTLIDKFASQCEELCKDKKWHIQRIELNNNPFSAVHYSFREGDKLGPCLQFDKPNYAMLIFGIAEQENLPSYPKEIKDTLDSAFGVSKTCSHWPWYRCANPNDTILPVPANWKDNPEVWSMIENGAMIKLWEKAVCKIYDVLEEANLLDKLSGR